MVFKRIKTSILLLFATFYLVMAADDMFTDTGEDEVNLVVKKSPAILHEGASAECTVHQGDNITLIACPEGGYELYVTKALAATT